MDDRRHRMLLGCILAVAAFLPCVFFLGPRSVDHFLLTESADRMLKGTFAPSPWPQTMRFGILLPLAALQGAFGVRPGSAAALTIAGSLLHVFAAYALARALFSPRTALAAAAIVAVLPLETIQATLLYPDLLQAAFATAGLALLVRESGREPPRPLPVLGAGILFAASYGVKQTVALLLVFVAGWIVLERRWRLVPAAIPVLAAIALESWTTARLTGDPFYRHTTSNAFLADLNRASFASFGPAGLMLRFPSLLWNPLDRGVPYLAGLAFPFAAAAWRMRAERPVRFLAGAWAVMLVLATVWPVRLRPYVPALVPDERHLFMLVAPMAAVVAEGLLRLGPRLRAASAAGFVALALGATVLIHAYLGRADAGPRAAFEVLRDRGAAAVRAVDPYGRDPMLYRYLAGYRSVPSIEPYRVEDLPDLRNAWIVIDDRATIHRTSPKGVVAGRDLEIPASWEKAWSGTFPPPRDPRKESGDGYEVRVFRVP